MGALDGKGTMYFRNGDRYEGEFEYKRGMHGIGYMYYRGGRIEKVRTENNRIIKILEKNVSNIPRKTLNQEESIEEVTEESNEEKVIVDKMDIGEAKLQCKDIGFTEGTESFGKCVLDLTK